MTLAEKIKIGEIMRHKPVTVNSKCTIYRAAALMDKENIGTVLVVNDNDKLLGIVTDRQIITKVIAHHKNLITTTIDEIMTRWPITISPEDSCKEVLKKMGEFGFRRLPIEDNGKLVGIVSISDLAPVCEFDDTCIKDIVKELSSDTRAK